jgi:hypothetical protein
MSSEAKPVFDAGSDGPRQPIEENYLEGCLRRSDVKHMPQGGLDDCYFFANLIVLTDGRWPI